MRVASIGSDSGGPRAPVSCSDSTDDGSGPSTCSRLRLQKLAPISARRQPSPSLDGSTVGGLPPLSLPRLPRSGEWLIIYLTPNFCSRSVINTFMAVSCREAKTVKSQERKNKTGYVVTRPNGSERLKFESLGHDPPTAAELLSRLSPTGAACLPSVFTPTSLTMLARGTLPGTRGIDTRRSSVRIQHLECRYKLKC